MERARDTSARRRKALRGLFPVVSEKNAGFCRVKCGITVDEAVVRAYAGLDRAQGEDMAVPVVRGRQAAFRPLLMTVHDDAVSAEWSWCAAA